MHIPKPTEGGDFELPPAGGPYMATCYRFLDLGTQHSEAYNKTAHKVLIGWELIDEQDSQGRPFLIAKRYTWSMHEKAALRKDLEAWRGRPFIEADFGPGGFTTKRLLGQGCQIMIEHSPSQTGDRTYANIAAIMALPKGATAQRTVTPHEYLTLDASEFDLAVFAALGDGLRKVIENSPEYRMLNGRSPQRTPAPGPVSAPPMRRDAGLDRAQQQRAQSYAVAERELVYTNDLNDEIPF